MGNICHFCLSDGSDELEKLEESDRERKNLWPVWRCYTGTANMYTTCIPAVYTTQSTVQTK